MELPLLFQSIIKICITQPNDNYLLIHHLVLSVPEAVHTQLFIEAK